MVLEVSSLFHGSWGLFTACGVGLHLRHLTLSSSTKTCSSTLLPNEQDAVGAASAMPDDMSMIPYGGNLDVVL